MVVDRHLQMDQSTVGETELLVAMPFVRFLFLVTVVRPGAPFVVFFLYKVRSACFDGPEEGRMMPRRLESWVGKNSLRAWSTGCHTLFSIKESVEQAGMNS